VVWLLAASAVVLVLLVLEETRDDGRPPHHPELAQLPFPDPDRYDYAAGADAMCGGALAELMRERHYYPLRYPHRATEDRGFTCRYGVPRAYQLEEGAVGLEIDLTLVRGSEARDLYRFEADHTPEAGSARYAFEAGEEGIVTYRDGEARAVFRSGEDAYALELAGERIGFLNGQKGRPHSEKFLFREISELVRLLGGAPSAGEPPVVPPVKEPYPGLPELTAPLPPLTGDSEERCAALTAVAARHSLVPDEDRTDASEERTLCHYRPEDSRGSQPEDHPRLVISVDVTDASKQDGDESDAREDLGGTLAAWLSSLHSGAGPAPADHIGPLYALPYGDPGEFGYLFHTEQRWTEELSYGRVLAGYVLGPAVVEVAIQGSRKGGDGVEAYPMTEAELAEVLIQVLEAMDIA
jgi:hypothetical protein